MTQTQTAAPRAARHRAEYTELENAFRDALFGLGLPLHGVELLRSEEGHRFTRSTFDLRVGGNLIVADKTTDEIKFILIGIMAAKNVLVDFGGMPADRINLRPSDADWKKLMDMLAPETNVVPMPANGNKGGRGRKAAEKVERAYSGRRAAARVRIGGALATELARQTVAPTTTPKPAHNKRMGDLEAQIFRK